MHKCRLLYTKKRFVIPEPLPEKCLREESQQYWSAGAKHSFKTGALSKDIFEKVEHEKTFVDVVTARAAPLRKYCDLIDQKNPLLARLHVYSYPSVYIYFLAQDDIPITSYYLTEMNYHVSILPQNPENLRPNPKNYANILAVEATTQFTSF